MVGWLNNDWGYVGVVVTDVLSGDSDALWRIESDDPTYILEVRDELASGLHPLADAESAAVLGEN
jgi:beta-glucosidase-like glycosyl hydrolase